MGQPKEQVERRVTITFKSTQVITVMAQNAAEAKRASRDPRNWKTIGLPKRDDVSIRAAAGIKGNGDPS
ncbi:MAG TPA: hypothetical protein VMF31_10505 [Solirubrobacterales bacterium]|nr:hypothetical protein [Solirubrobacterales bacterium]